MAGALALPLLSFTLPLPRQTPGSRKRLKDGEANILGSLMNGPTLYIAYLPPAFSEPVITIIVVPSGISESLQAMALVLFQSDPK